MKLILDCTSLAKWTEYPTGIQRVIVEIGEKLQKIFPSLYVALFEPSGKVVNYDISNHKKSAEIIVDSGDIILTAGSNWDIPVHHKNLGNLHAQGCHIVTLFYDLIPIIMPYSFGPGFSEVYKNWLIETLNYSEISFSISENTRLDLLSFSRSMGIACPDLYTIRLGDEIVSHVIEPSKRIQDISKKPYLLCVGTIEFRKNHKTLLNAYRYLIDVRKYNPPLLIIVGKTGWLDQDITHQIDNDLRLYDRVLILNDLSNSELSYLYQHAEFTLYPSIYEGWGLPISESLCYGTPCIASDNSSMLEIAPGLVTYVPATNAIAWAEQIAHLSENKEELTKQTKRVKDKYIPTDWQSSAYEVLQILLDRFPQLNKIKS